MASEAGAVAGCRDAFLDNVQLNEVMARSDEERSRFAEHDQHMAEQESQAWHRCAPCGPLKHSQLSISISLMSLVVDMHCW